MCTYSAQQLQQKFVQIIMKEKVFIIQLILYQFGYARVQYGGHMSKSQFVYNTFISYMYTG